MSWRYMGMRRSKSSLLSFWFINSPSRPLQRYINSAYPLDCHVDVVVELPPILGVDADPEMWVTCPWPAILYMIPVSSPTELNTHSFGMQFLLQFPHSHINRAHWITFPDVDGATSSDSLLHYLYSPPILLFPEQGHDNILQSKYPSW